MNVPYRSFGNCCVGLKKILQRSAQTPIAPELWETLSHECGQEVYSEALYCLTRLELPPKEARESLIAILEHQRKMSAQLKRNVSLITATSDYFTHVQSLVRDPILVEVRLLQQKEECAFRDELTGLFNRRFFNQEIPREMERFRRFGQAFSLLMLDLDHFKIFNDTYGHSAGDQALRDVARILLDTARLYDRPVRYGGEEFAIILPQTNGDEAMIVAERIRESMERHRIHYAGRDVGVITISIGLAVYPKDSMDMDGLVQCADLALYQAKELRNCVRQFHDHKRNHRRYSLTAPLPLHMETEQQDKLEANALDISFGGLSCSSDAPLPASTLLRLVLSDAAGSIHLPLEAEVRRVRKAQDKSYHLGLSFRLNGVEDQIKLMTLLDGRLDISPQSGPSGSNPPSA